MPTPGTARVPRAASCDRCARRPTEVIRRPLAQVAQCLRGSVSWYRSPCPPSAPPNSSGPADPPAQIAPYTAGSAGTDHRARPPNRRRDAND